MSRSAGSDVYWLEQTACDVPDGDDWLSVSEANRLRGMRFPKRRTDWRLGRWTAKRAVAAHLGLPADAGSLAGIEIRSAASGAPEVDSLSISLSHRDGAAICAVAEAGVALGCDLEIVEPRSEAFAADYFTPDERSLVARAPAADRSRLLALLWSAKESALKALNVGLRLDTRSVAVEAIGRHPPADCWLPFEARVPGALLHGWWQPSGRFVRTVVAEPQPRTPLRLFLRGSENQLHNSATTLPFTSSRG